MNVERARAFLLSLPHVAETMQWGDNLVFWVADKAVGGKMFALIALDADARDGEPVISFAVGPTHFPDLLEIEGCIPAPYLARAFWIAATGWSVFPAAEWQQHLACAHALTLDKLPRKTRSVLALPAVEANRHITAARQAALAKVKPAKASRK